jgi:outer membrane protein OmpA-like peptidoglycan-associated protein
MNYSSLAMKNLAVFLIGSFFLFQASQAMSQGDKKALKEAERYLGYEEYKQAIPHLDEAVRINPNNALSQFLLGKCLMINYEKKRALGHLEKAFNLNKDLDPELNLYYAMALHYVLEFDKAIEQYQRALARMDTKDPRVKEIALAVGHCKYGKEGVKSPVDAKIVNVGPPINTQNSEHSPVIDAQDNVMIYTTVRPDNQGCNNDPSCVLEDIYISEKNGEKWGTPKPMDRINSKAFDASIALSPDGQTLYLYRNPPGNGDVFVSELEGKNWSTPRALPEPVNSKSYETTVSISPDGKRLFFTSDREGGLGDTDIYMSDLGENGKWGPAVNLGPKINTPYADDSPFIHADGKSLYFSSKGHKKCFGGFDIYLTVLQDNGSWSEPQNVGYPINTPDNDIYFVLSADKKSGYYASAKEGGYGEKDIYKIIMPEEKPAIAVVEEKKDTTTATPTNVVPVVNALTILKGVVTDAKTSSPIEASIKVIDNDKNQVVSTFHSNSATGRYLVSLPSGRNYGIVVEHPDYLFKSVNVNIPTSEGYQEITKDIQLDKIEVGVGIVLNNIFYDYDKSTLRPESKSELDRLLAFMQENPTIKVEIGSHTDSDGSDSYNEKLSQSRAQSVVDYLKENGVTESRLVAKGYGEKVPVAPNDTPENKQLNRRSELKILEK